MKLALAAVTGARSIPNAFRATNLLVSSQFAFSLLATQLLLWHSALTGGRFTAPTSKDGLANN